MAKRECHCVYSNSLTLLELYNKIEKNGRFSLKIVSHIIDVSKILVGVFISINKTVDSIFQQNAEYIFAYCRSQAIYSVYYSINIIYKEFNTCNS